MFLPPGSAGFAGLEDPRYPTPNLYDLVLQLNSEPGLEQWWATVTNILHDHFKADRASLVLPVDPTDIENVPWGQKSTFNMHGPELTGQTQPPTPAALQRPELVLRGPSTESPADVRPQKLHPERLRPRLDQRHSYAGPGREAREMLGATNDAAAKKPVRPQMMSRTATHAGVTPTPTFQPRMPPSRLSSSQSIRQSSINDVDFSSIGGVSDDAPYAEVFQALRPLEQESRPLIESIGVNRVLERGSVVAITRDYVSDVSNDKISKSAPSPAPFANDKTFGNYRSVFAVDNDPNTLRDYEEYEQQPTSPWTQSPAPSPAIQADEEANPFFAQGDQQLEDSFNPAVSPKDYAQFAQVEAIGVDHASTIIHIPLIHPTLSQPMQSLKVTARSKRRPSGIEGSDTVDWERRAPVAILSVLTDTVPYPHNLTHTLKLLGPHLATSFAIAQQLSASTSQVVNIRHRRTASGQKATTAPMTVEPASLDDIARADLEEPSSSISEPMTSPSDYSGRSRISPSGSIVGTPGWDPAAHGWTASRSAAGTPALTGSEIVDNYFDSKKRSGQRTASNASNNTPARPVKRNSGSDAGAITYAVEDDPSKTPRSERRSRDYSSPTQDNATAAPHPRDRSPPRTTESSSQHRPGMRPAMSHLPDMSQTKQHSLLHSYGADFQHSFGAFPAYGSMEPRVSGSAAHARKGSYPEDMPPPSERLLRTIIDSVPVQIFTAQPETGTLSWVNSKFLVYRGQEPRQVLQDPWQAIHPDDRNEFLPAWHRSLRTNQQLQQKVRLQRFDGGYRWFYVRAAPLRDKRQKVVHWIGTMMDFHEQQIAEINSARQQETAASEAKYRTLANSSPQIVFAVNRVKGITFCNTQWMHYSGQTEAQALGVGFMDHVHPDDLAKCRLPVFDGESNTPKNVPTSVPAEPKRTTSMSTTSDDSSETEKGGGNRSDFASSPVGHMPQRKLSELASVGILKVSRDADGRPSYSTEVRLKSKDGDYRWHLVRVLRAEHTVLPNEEETWYGTCTDINDHKTLERDLKENMDEKSRFLSNMSHEIRTPLNGITGMVNFLIDSSLTAEQMEHVNIIRASTEGLRGLINDILDLSKAEAGMIQLSMDWLYVRALIEEVNDLTSAMAIDKGLELNYVVEEDVPPQIKGDRFRIRQILLNIVGNAIKFTQTGEVFVRCCLQTDTVDLEENEAFINFEIVDTGRGFTDAEAEYLFKRFSQIDGSSTRQHGGTGLGKQWKFSSIQ
jgi:PAS domain S-box-containing protein